MSPNMARHLLLLPLLDLIADHLGATDRLPLGEVEGHRLALRHVPNSAFFPGVDGLTNKLCLCCSNIAGVKPSLWK
jgi:hypothetical protein